MQLKEPLKKSKMPDGKMPVDVLVELRETPRFHPVTDQASSGKPPSATTPDSSETTANPEKTLSSATPKTTT